MSAASRSAIDTAIAANFGSYVSPISAWEIATLIAKNRIRLRQSAEEWFASLLRLPGVRLAEMGPRILIASAQQPGTPPGDPADRIIAATARNFGYVLITRDSKLLSYARARHIGAIRC
jgi:PIN domain nuclease of toxin-antitoxin system